MGVTGFVSLRSERLEVKLPPVNFEGESFGDPRFGHLARLLGMQNGDGHFALIKVGLVWAWQTEHYTPESPCFVVASRVIEMALGDSGPTAMVRAGLAEETPDGYRIKGSNHKRTGWLWRLKNKAQKGGEASAAKRSKKSRTDAKTSKPIDKMTPVVGQESTAGQQRVIPLNSYLSSLSEEERKKTARPDSAEPVQEAKPKTDHQRVIDTHWHEFLARRGSKPTITEETGAHAKRLLRSHSADEVCKRLRNFHQRPIGAYPSDDDFGTFVRNIDKFADPPRPTVQHGNGPRSRAL